ncbi:hypothetical protein FA95DRAFT_714838 [Auriscalpium vulgare]|uniref:Uncharacterized protein n=1 Tax=Auriscalpium vulgare TaxID=40419 RepID=A0ACB8RAW6_9AGAM|nr:hypothetical protein FA95DRAFT_714838 [Auriscalpium vulgare]
MPPSPTTAKAWLSTSTDSTPQSPEETFAAAFGSERSAERRLDTLDDAVSSVAQPIAAVTSFYSTNSSTIKAAFLALADITKATELGSKVDAWIGTVDKVLVGVEGLAKSQPFPFVETAVLLVRGIVKLETERRENNRRTRALILQIADMMGALLQLHNVRDPELVTERGQSVQGRIQVLMQRIEADVTECGALIDAYHKHSLTSKFFFSGSYADQFKARGETIVARKGDIIFALSIHTTVTVDEVRETVRANNGMLKQLVALAEHKSAQEEELERLVADLGGRSKVLDSDELLTQVSCEVQARLVIDEDSGGGGRDKAPSASTTLSPRERHDLRLSLETILQENADHFAHKLEAQVKLMTAEIQLYIRLSTAEIIRRLDVGPYERIDHPDIRELWKQMRWRFSVKGHDFIKALQEYYFDKIAEGDRRAPVYDSSERTMTEDERKLQDDKWCLRFLGVEYEAPVLEAFDTDNSGFIRISEVNEFTNSIPDEWSLLQAVAYWAQGWSLETAIYARSVFRLLEQMRTDCENVLIENSRMFQWYFRSGWASDVDRLIYCAAEKHVRTMAWNQLDTMVRDNMARTEARLLKALTAFSYDIDEPHSVELVVGGRPLEQVPCSHYYFSYFDITIAS